MTGLDEPVLCRASGCGLPLRSKLSRERGFGTVCWERLHPRPLARHRIPGGRTPAPPRPVEPAAGPDLLDQLEEQP